jgi:hypothetical protein
MTSVLYQKRQGIFLAYGTETDVMYLNILEELLILCLEEEDPNNMAFQQEGTCDPTF